MSIEEAAYKSRLACLDEWRQDAVDRRSNEASKLTEKTDKGNRPPKKGDSVKLRTLNQDNQKSYKLEPQWEGPYLINRVSAHGRLVWLKDVASNTIEDRYHVNDTQIYVERKDHEDDNENWRSVSEINKKIRVKVRQWIRRRTHRRGEDYFCVSSPLSGRD